MYLEDIEAAGGAAIAEPSRRRPRPSSRRKPIRRSRQTRLRWSLQVWRFRLGPQVCSIFGQAARCPLADRMRRAERRTTPTPRQHARLRSCRPHPTRSPLQAPAAASSQSRWRHELLQGRCCPWRCRSCCRHYLRCCPSRRRRHPPQPRPTRQTHSARSCRWGERSRSSSAVHHSRARRRRCPAARWIRCQSASHCHWQQRQAPAPTGWCTSRGLYSRCCHRSCRRRRAGQQAARSGSPAPEAGAGQLMSIGMFGIGLKAVMYI